MNNLDLIELLDDKIIKEADDIAELKKAYYVKSEIKYREFKDRQNHNLIKIEAFRELKDYVEKRM